MKRLFALLVLAFAAYACQMPKITDENINEAIAKGEFAQAEQMIKLKIATEELTPGQVWELDAKVQTMNRIRKDFSKDDTTVVAYIKKIIPDITQEQLANWESTGALECMMIDGVKKYFWNAPRNLFRINKEAQAHWDVKGRQSDELDVFLADYIPSVVTQTSKDKIENLSAPKKFKINYSITVKPNEVPEGEMIRVWMPYPRESKRSTNVKLLSTTNKDYIISPDEYEHKSIYMEAPAVKDSAIKFGYELELEIADHWFNFGPEDVKPYDTESELYKKYTAERKTHVIFTPEIKALTDSIIAGETNPLVKAQKIFDHIAKTYPWASAREYATLDNIPAYVLKNNHGDCGQVGLTFITMARYAGIPAKWQSGWMLHPGEVNLHDWAQAYFEGIGWVPVDVSFGLVPNENDDVYHFYLGGIDGYRYYVNEDYSGNFFPAKNHLRSETVDFQRGEVEWRGENLYFGRWSYRMNVEYL